ncbi:MAG: discoidin domain-containing protein, partial [Lachnospiraceae bacterium]
YPDSNITDNNDRSWWIAGDEKLPQVIVMSLEEPTYVTASRIVFQKDSSSYRHKVETSVDGEKWLELYARECTGWEFKPMTVDCEMKYLRLTIESVSEGRAGLAEISLY